MSDNTFKWDDKQQDEVIQDVNPLDGVDIIDNNGLSAERMKELVQQQRTIYPGESIEPIVFGSLNDNSRFYVIKSISMEDMETIDKIFEVLQKEQVVKQTNKARQEYCEIHKLDADEIPDTHEDGLKTHIEGYLELKSASVLQTVNDTAINMVCVVWPPSHKELVQANKAHMGDVISIALSAQVLSGWSSISTDIDSYAENIKEPTSEEERLMQDISS